MVRAWLGDNSDVQDISVNISDLSEPRSPLEGMVANLERVYDIAKMISPSMVFLTKETLSPRVVHPRAGAPTIR